MSHQSQVPVSPLWSRDERSALIARINKDIATLRGSSNPIRKLVRKGKPSSPELRSRMKHLRLLKGMVETLSNSCLETNRALFRDYVSYPGNRSV